MFRKVLRHSYFFGHHVKAIVGQKAPLFAGAAITKGKHTSVSLSDMNGKYVVLFFYPLDFTFVCPTEIVEFSRRVGEFKKLNTQVVGCSTGSQYSKEAWSNLSRKKGGLGKINYPLLADPTHKISKTYGVYLKELGFPLRGTFIIDDTGVLRHLSHNDLPVGRSVDEVGFSFFEFNYFKIKRLVQGFQYHDKTGEVVPCQWKGKGDPTMAPDHGEGITKKYWKHIMDATKDK